MTTATHGPLQVTTFVDAMFQVNTLLLRADGAAECWVIDPGFPPSAAQVAEAITRQGLGPVTVVLTHGHVDHLAGVAALREAVPGLTVTAPRGDAHMLTDADANLSAPFGVPIVAGPPDRLMNPGDTLELGGLRFDVRDVSGHSPGGVALYCAAAGVVIAGDALFAGSIGRTDFPGSSTRRLLSNIRAHLLTLPADTVVYCGHGPGTTIGAERNTNPFLQPGGVDL